MNEIKTGGFLLLSGAFIFLITIFFEYKIGWIGMERPSTDIPYFIRDNWDVLKVVWGWQTLAHILFILSYILLLKNSKGVLSLLWSFMILCGILLITSMGLTLGSYFPALLVYEDQPQLFNTVRGAIRLLYFPSQIGSTLLLAIYIIELTGKNGIINKKPGWITLGVVIITLILGMVTNIQMKVVGAVWFILPLVLGGSYWRNMK